MYKNYYVYNQLSDAEKSYWDALDAVCMKYLTTETDANTDGTYNYLCLLYTSMDFESYNAADRIRLCGKQ